MRIRRIFLAITIVALSVGPGCTILPSAPRRLAFSSDGQYLAAAGNARVTIWKTETGDVIAREVLAGRVHDDPLAFSPDGSVLAIGARGIQMLSLARGLRVESFSAVEEVDEVCFANRGQHIVASSWSEELTKIWSIPSKRAVVTNVGDEWRVGSAATTFTAGLGLRATPRALACSPEGTLLAIGYSSNLVNVFELNKLLTLTGNKKFGGEAFRFQIDLRNPQLGDLFGLALVESANSLMVCSRGGLTVIDLQTRASGPTLACHCRSVAVSGGTVPRVATLTLDGQVLLWDLSVRKSLTLPVAHSTALAMSPDGSKVAVADTEGSVYLCNIDTSNIACRSVLKM